MNLRSVQSFIELFFPAIADYGRHHLPQGHQDKPADDWLSRTVARVTASVAAEAATALGYEVSFFVSFFYLLFIFHESHHLTWSNVVLDSPLPASAL